MNGGAGDSVTAAPGQRGPPENSQRLSTTSIGNKWLKGIHMLKLGDTSPDFTGPKVLGGEFTLSDYRGANVVLYFFVKAFTWG